MMVHYDPEFYRGKRVFVTGHTGFKGSWLCKMLLMAGAEVTGYSPAATDAAEPFLHRRRRGQDAQRHRRHPRL